MSGNPLSRFYRNWYRGTTPVSMALVIANVITFFSFSIMKWSDPLLHLAFRNVAFPQQFWTLITWPLYGAGPPFSVLFACLLLLWVGGSLERSWGSPVFAKFFFATAALTALTTWIGTQVLHQPAFLVGVLYASAAPAVAWAAINRQERMMFYGFVPVTAPVIGAIAVVVVWYDLGPVLGLFALSGCAAAYWYAMKGRYLPGGGRGYAAARKPSKPNLRLHVVDAPPKGRDAPLGGLPPTRWFRAWQERRKLAKLWKRSGLSDADEPGGMGSRQDRR